MFTQSTSRLPSSRTRTIRIARALFACCGFMLCAVLATGAESLPTSPLTITPEANVWSGGALKPVLPAPKVVAPQWNSGGGETIVGVYAEFNTTLKPAEWQGFSLGPSSQNRGFFVEITPSVAAAAGATIDRVVVQPEYSAAQGAWNDVLRVQLPSGAEPLAANLRVYETSRLPVVADFPTTLQPGVWHGWILGPVSANRGYVAEVSPLVPSPVDGATIARYQVQAEFFQGQWIDVLRVQLPEWVPALDVNLRVYETPRLPVVTDFETESLQEGWHAWTLGPSSPKRGYVTEITPLDPSLSGYIDEYLIRPEFDGRQWNDVLRVHHLREAIRWNLRVYATARSVYDGPSLKLSAKVDRTNAAPLHGALVFGTMYAFTSPEQGVAQVEFRLDGQWVRTESMAPFDLAGTNAAGLANPYDFSRLAPGAHTVSARLSGPDGDVRIVNAGFSVPGLFRSESASRSNPVPLDGQRVATGNLFAFILPDEGIIRAEFRIDGRLVKVENLAPFDLAGTARDGSALPFCAAKLPAGPHEVTALITNKLGRSGFVQAHISR